MKETFKELNLTNMSSLPNSYLYQPDPEYRKWTTKRGKKSYFDTKQMSRMKDFFLQLDTDKSGMIGPQEIEETLISLGLARTREDVEDIVKSLDADGNGELDFEEFLQMFKETSLINPKQNYLSDRDLQFKKVDPKKGHRHNQSEVLNGSILPPLTGFASQEEYNEFNIDKFQENLRGGHNKELDLKEKDPKVIEKKKAVRKMISEKMDYGKKKKKEGSSLSSYRERKEDQSRLTSVLDSKTLADDRSQ